MAKAKAAKRGPGRPPTLGEKGAGKTIQVRPGSERQARLRKWAKAQPDKPGESEAVRRLLDQALDAAGF